MTYDEGKNEQRHLQPKWQPADVEVEIGVAADGTPIPGETQDQAAERARNMVKDKKLRSFNVWQTGQVKKVMPVASERSSAGYWTAIEEQEAEKQKKKEEGGG